MLRTLLAILVVPAAGLLIWLALARPAPRADLVVAAEESRTIDPARVSWMSEIQISAAMFEGLTRLDPKTLAPLPASAARWDVNADQTVYTFHLRQNGRWSNGDPLTAADFVYSWRRALHPKTRAQYASLLWVIAGAEPYYRSRLNNDAGDDAPPESLGVIARDDRTLEVRLNAPCSYFLDLTSFITLAPVHGPTVERWSQPDPDAPDTSHLWTRPQHIVCNGAFILKRWAFKDGLRLERNPLYNGPAPGGVETIEIFSTADPNIALLGYESGRIDFLRGVSTSTARELRAAQIRGERSDFHLGDRFATYFFRVNCRRPPLDNAAVRQALSLAIDKEALCESVMGLGETPADTFVPRGAIPLMPRKVAASGDSAANAPTNVVFYEPPPGLGHGLTYAERCVAARAILAQAGIDPAELRPIRIAYSPHPDQQRVAEAVQAMWLSGLGVRAELQRIESKVLSQMIRNLDYDLARSDWFGDYLDPASFLEMYTSGSGQNRTGWSNVEYDRLIAAAAREPDNARRYALLHEAEQILTQEELPVIPLFFRRGNFLLRPGFEGLHDNVRDVLPIHLVRRSAPAR